MKKSKTVKNMPLVTRIVTYVCLAWALLISLFPLVWLVLSSLKKDPMARPGFQLPESICLDGYISTFRDLHVFRYFGNSLFVAGVSVLISVLMISMSAYIVARMEFKGKKLVNILLYSTMFIPATALTYPVYNLVNRLHIYDTRSALILIYSCSGIAVSFFVIKNYYDNIPRDLEEAARIDGASEFLTFRRVIIPLSVPVIATVGLFTGLAYWNDWINGLYYINDPSLYSIQNLLIRLMNNIQYLNSGAAAGVVSGGTSTLPSTSVRMAIAVVGVIPVVIAYPFLQKYLIRGTVIGAVKG